VLAWAYPDRIAQLRSSAAGMSGQRYLLANGRGAALDQVSTLASATFLVALDLDDTTGSEARIRLAAPLTREQLETALASRITESVETDIDPRSGAMRARRVRRLDALILEERRAELAPEDAAQALLAQLRRQGLDALPWGEAGSRLRARLQFVAIHGTGNNVDWPPSDTAALLADVEHWLAPWLHGLNRLEQLGSAKLSEALLSRYSHAQRKWLDEFAPLQLTVPTGTRVSVDYEDDNAPCIEVRMQEVFGLADTPRIAGGRVPVALKLLSPARRPMQITRDLAGFWRGSYADVRKDMRGRYPRHYWPENPLEAEPLRGLRPRR
jgi:ATP-dependent helicase HrpB